MCRKTKTLEFCLCVFEEIETALCGQETITKEANFDVSKKQN